MGRKKSKQTTLFVPHTVAQAPGHRFYEKLNELLQGHDFDLFVEAQCEPYYDPNRSRGRQSIPPGLYFRMLLIGFFEGIESERGICWRCADSLSLRGFLGLNLDDSIPDHSTLSRTRTRLPSSVYDAVFKHVLSIVHAEGLLHGKVAGVDSTYLRADASMKAIIRRDTQEEYQDYLKRLAQEAGIENPTAEEARRLDRRRPKKTSNAEWASKADPEARIARLKDDRTRLAYKAEHVTDLETGAILAARVTPADAADTATIETSLEKARENVLSAVDDDDDDDDGPKDTGGGGSGLLTAVEVVADKGYHKTAVIASLGEAGFRTYIPEPRGKHRRRWADKDESLRRAALANRARTRRAKGKRHQRRRGEYLEQSFAHICETGGGRRTRLRGRENVEKRHLLLAAAANLALVMRSRLGKGTPRAWAEARAAALALLALCYALVTLVRTWIPQVPRRLLDCATPQDWVHHHRSQFLEPIRSTGC